MPPINYIIDLNLFYTNACNFNCSYCGQFQHDDNYIDFDILKLQYIKVLDEILIKIKKDEYFKNNHVVYIHLQGGEVSTDSRCFDPIKELFNYIKDNILHTDMNIYISILTNFSNYKFFKRISAIAKPLNIELLITLHEEYITEKKLIIYIHQCSELIKNGFSIIFNILYSTSPKLLKLLKLITKYNSDINNNHIKIQKDHLIKKGKNWNGLYGLPFSKEKELFSNKYDNTCVLHLEKNKIYSEVDNMIYNTSDFKLIFAKRKEFLNV